MRNGEATKALLHGLALSLPSYFVAASLLNKLHSAPPSLVAYLSFLAPNEALARVTSFLSTCTSQDTSLAISLSPSLVSTLGAQHIALLGNLAAPLPGSSQWTQVCLRAFQFLSQRLPLDVLLHPLPRALSPLAGPVLGSVSDSSRPFTSQQLIEACVMRINQLLAITKATPPPLTATIEEETLNVRCCLLVLDD